MHGERFIVVVVQFHLPSTSSSSDVLLLPVLDL